MLSAVAPKPRSSRMSLDTVVCGPKSQPDRVLVYGTNGIGKSSWAAAAPAPIFIEPEDGTDRLDVARFPQPQSWPDILDAVHELTVGAHEYQTVVLDTLDAAEALLWKFLCERDEQESIESYGYGRGYNIALDQWRVLLSALEKLRRDRQVGVIFVAHSWIKSFKNPAGDDFDRYELKLHARAAGLMRDWCDAVLFAHYESYSVRDDKTGAAKGVSTGARVLHTEWSAAWDAKNRDSLPPVLPLHFDDYVAAKKARRTAEPERLRATITAKLAEVGDADLTAKVAALMEQAGEDAEALAKIDNRMTATVRSRKGA